MSPTGVAVGPAGSAPVDGEHLSAEFRLVVSPVAGVFRRNASVSAGAVVAAGQVLGVANDAAIRTRFDGRIVEILVHDGERLVAFQPVAWIVPSVAPSVAGGHRP